MRVQLLTIAAGPEGVWLPGSVVDVAPETARALLAGGYAILPPMDRRPVPPEQAVERVPERSKRR